MELILPNSIASLLTCEHTIFSPNLIISFCFLFNLCIILMWDFNLELNLHPSLSLVLRPSPLGLQHIIVRVNYVYWESALVNFSSCDYILPSCPVYIWRRNDFFAVFLENYFGACLHLLRFWIFFWIAIVALCKVVLWIFGMNGHFTWIYLCSDDFMATEALQLYLTG